ncbi:hypothetical protein CRX42_07400 [Pseudomonas jessenii]|uniref:Uncharacterized protein n=1 Tax=Pseudomonas jessenii TaxID=77298 RepID=A0A2W0ES52_PSEJE|nr:hypothetical protein [Pseudomonas jessenii]PYY71233.1 hypothetical protein CRX42_07400 [Pseudomonas jessenii]
MARKQGKAGDQDDVKIWTNVSQNPVILADGSMVAAGGQTTPEQAEHAEGSFWEEHGVLVIGTSVLTDDGAGQIEALGAEIEDLRSQLVTSGSEKDALLAEIEELKAKITKAE